MSRMPNNEKLYQSIYGATKLIRPAQYLAELVVKRRTERKKIDLPHQFWLQKYEEQYGYWKNVFVAECIHAERLMKEYDCDCIINAFNSYDCQKILSVTNKKLKEISRELQRQKNNIEQTREKINIIVANPNVFSTNIRGKGSKISKLK